MEIFCKVGPLVYLSSGLHMQQQVVDDVEDHGVLNRVSGYLKIVVNKGEGVHSPCYINIIKLFKAHEMLPSSPYTGTVNKNIRSSPFFKR